MSTTPSALSLSNIDAFYGYAQALFGMSLDVSPGETVGLLGRNGAGKSTTFRAVLGLDVARRGSVRLGGEEVSGEPPEAIARRGVSWVPEDRRIFTALTVMENLQLAAAVSGDGDLPIEDILETLPLLKPLLKRRGDQLSGGEQQAVAIARALASRPRVLLLDEPTEGLAPLIVEKLEAAIVSLPERFGVSIILAEQNLGFVLRLAQRVYILETGHLVHEGSADEFAVSDDLQHRYLSVTSSRSLDDDDE